MPFRKAFTLIEMITVLTIILIVLAIAIPVWNALLGGTNLAAAQNQITAFLANARADAVYNKQPIGVFFFIDPNSQQTAMAEVQVQTLLQVPYGQAAASYTSLYQPNVSNPNVDNGPTYSLEMVNYADPTTPGNYIFYRDIILLPKGVGVALSNNTYTYNQLNLWNYPSNYNTASPPAAQANYPATIPPLDRYVRFGAIMFNADGTLASIPIAVPYQGQFPGASSKVTNALYTHLGLVTSNAGFDWGSMESYAPAAGVTPQHLPLISSCGLVVFDEDTFLSQHAGPTTVKDNTTPGSPTTASNFGDGSQFSNIDMMYSTVGTLPPTTTSTAFARDKFIEESWIDQNSTAYAVSPFTGSLIRSK